MLTPNEKQSLVEAMLTEACEIEEPHVVHELAQLAWHDLKLMESRLNEIISNAEMRGRMEVLLERAWYCQHSLACPNCGGPMEIPF